MLTDLQKQIINKIESLPIKDKWFWFSSGDDKIGILSRNFRLNPITDSAYYEIYAESVD